MKTSNVTLFVLFATGAVLIGAIPITLHNKLKSGDYTTISDEIDYKTESLSFSNMPMIVVEDLDDCTIIPSDSFYLEVERSVAEMLELTHRNDTFFVRGQGLRPPKIRLFLPSVDKITIRRSDVLLRGSIGHLDQRSYYLDLDDAKLCTLPISEDPRIFQFLNNVTITGTGSAKLELKGSVRINKLILKDINSILSDNHVGANEMEVYYNGKRSVQSRSMNGKMDIRAD